MPTVQRCDFYTGDVINGRYRVAKQLGEGSFGIVYKVTDHESGDVMALKILKLWAIPAEERELLMKRFDREYETGRIESNYLVHSSAKGEVQGNPFIVMEFCSGGDLQKAVRERRVNLGDASKEILHGLHDLHQNGKVHRDMKPENVLLRGDGTAVLTDFGIAGDRNNRLTRHGIAGIPKQIFGTFAYMPPEQANPRRGSATVLPTTDIFSFGVMMYEMLVGALPFGPLESDRDLPSYVTNAKNGRWDRAALQTIPHGDDWLRLIDRCLDPNCTTRIQTAAEAVKLVPAVAGTGRNGRPVCHDFHDDGNWQRHAVNGLQLRVMEGEEHGRIYRLNEMLKNPCSILTMGRMSDSWQNRIDLKEEESCYVSRRHCTLEWNRQQAQWILRDGQWVTSGSQPGWKQSLNGTYLNSQEVGSGGSLIIPGDIITVGDIKMRVEGY